MNQDDFLNWFVTAGGAALLVSFVAELFPQWDTLAAATKIRIMKASVVGLAILAYLGVQFAPGAMVYAAEIAKMVGGLVVVWGGQQAYHKIQNPPDVKPT